MGASEGEGVLMVECKTAVLEHRKTRRQEKCITIYVTR